MLAAPRTVVAADVDIELTLSNPGSVISPHIYGHFIEHLGGVIYDGIWVGPDSKIPNVGGIRKQFLDDMKRIGAPNLRWPGGCFADGYHWRDGIGKTSARPRTYSYWETSMPAGLHATESNHFGIHEFMRLCRLVGAEPYVAGNVGSGTPREFHDWVSYCNAPTGTLSLADERAGNGDKEPFNVKYWGVGNESWGCGGTMHPHEYAGHYRRFVTQFPSYVKPFLVATGPRGHSANGDMGWTSGFFEALRGETMLNPILPDGFALHYYTDLRRTTVKAGDFNRTQWYEVLLRGARMETLINDHWSIMGKFDPAHRTKFVIDEWGVWYPTGEEITPAYILSQPITLRDAVHTGMHFDIFNRHTDEIAMCNVAQTINCIHSLFLAIEDKFTRTPVYHVFDMYRPHMGARLLPMKIQAPDLQVPSLNGTARLTGLSGSASIRDRRVTVTLTNPSLDSAITARIRTGQVSEAKGVVLTHPEMRAMNTFSKPDEVKPAPIAVKVTRGVVEVSLPPKSVTALQLMTN